MCGLWLGVGAAVAAGALASVAFAVTGANTITTVAGRSRFPGFAGDGGEARRALLGGINGIAVDRRGNVYIADTAGRRDSQGRAPRDDHHLRGHRRGPASRATPVRRGLAQLDAPRSRRRRGRQRLHRGWRRTTACARSAPAGVITTFAGTGGLPGFYGGHRPGDRGPAQHSPRRRRRRRRQRLHRRPLEPPRAQGHPGGRDHDVRRHRHGRLLRRHRTRRASPGSTIRRRRRRRRQRLHRRHREPSGAQGRPAGHDHDVRRPRQRANRSCLPSGSAESSTSAPPCACERSLPPARSPRWRATADRASPATAVDREGADGRRRRPGGGRSGKPVHR